jgi:hypothetical protein
LSPPRPHSSTTPGFCITTFMNLFWFTVKWNSPRLAQ